MTRHYLLTVLLITFCCFFDVHSVDLDLYEAVPPPYEVSACYNKGFQSNIPRRSIQWPQPESGYIKTTTDGTGLLVTDAIEFSPAVKDLPVEVQGAITEFLNEIKSHVPASKEAGKCSLPTDKVTKITFDIEKKTEVAAPGMVEAYSISMAKRGEVVIKSQTQFGARHGLVTIHNLMELVSCNKHVKFLNTDQGGFGGYYVLPVAELSVTDKPRLSHRGLMIDTSRAFTPIVQLKRIIRVMARAKMNVFHWHATDDQSFPLLMSKSAKLIHGNAGVDCYKSDTNPCLGAYSNAMTYPEDEIKKFVKYAKEHGIRVIIEVDMPSHARSWASADSTLMECGGLENQDHKFCAEPVCGPLALNKNGNKVLELAKLIVEDLSELTETGEYLHLGMDEVLAGCWGEEKKETLMKKYLAEMVNYSASLPKSRKIIVWQDVMLNYTEAIKSKGVVSHVWNNLDQAEELVKGGMDVIWSNYKSLYLDCGRGNPAVANFSSWCNPYKTWYDVYVETPEERFKPEQKKHVLGGEVCMWAEQANELNLEVLLWPRASAWAGSTWEKRSKSPIDTVELEKDFFEPQDRLKTFSLSMFRECIPFTPMQTMWCDFGDSVGTTGKRNDPRTYCDQYAKPYLVPKKESTTTTTTTQAPCVCETCKSCKSSTVQLSGQSVVASLVFLLALSQSV